MDYSNFELYNKDYIILVKEQHFIRTASGKSWSKKKENIIIEKKVYTVDNYNNYINSIPFFNNLGRCYAKLNFTYAGYIPTEVVSISPDGKEKIIATFKFLQKDQILQAAGYREKEILENAIEFTSDYISGRYIIEFIANIDNEKKICLWDDTNKKFVG